MKTFGSKLKELRKENSLTQEDLIEVINSKYEKSISKSMISKWENDKEEPSRYNDVIALADYFGVTNDYLMGFTDDEYGKRNEQTEYKKIPILGTIAAGVPMSSQEDVLGYEYILPNERVDFCLRVKGDSMINARIFDTDIVFIRKQSVVENGEIAAIQIDGEEATLKRFYNINGSVILRAENPNYKDMVFSKKDFKDIKILGKAISFKSEVK